MNDGRRSRPGLFAGGPPDTATCYANHLSHTAIDYRAGSERLRLGDRTPTRRGAACSPAAIVRVMPAPLALLPSPLLGPSVWQPVARVLTGRGWQATTSAVVGPVRTGKDALDGFLAALPTEQDLVLVAHSNAGAYIPALVTHRRVVAVVFVDAVLPPSLGNVPLAPPSFVDFLRVKADDSGLLPGWTEWWDEADVAALFPDAATRVRVEREQRRLPLSYFEGALTVPPGWDETPGRSWRSATPTPASATKPSDEGGR
jgi:hypothetical protein